MTVRVDNAPLIPGAVVIGATGRGILGSTILLAPVPGREPSVLASSVTPGTEGSEFRAKIVSYPVGGDLYMWEDGSYTYSGPPGTLVFERYRDGALLGTGSRTLGMAPGAVGRVMLVDTSSLVPGAVVVGVGGFGVLGHAVLAPTPPGRHTSLLASAVTTSAESSAYRVVITDKPAGSSLYVWEDGTYTYSGPPGTVSFDRYRDGLLYDTGSVSVGGGAALAGTADAMERADAGGGVAMLYALAGGHDALGTADSGGVLALFVIAPWIFTSELRAVRVTSDTYGLLGKFVKQPAEVLDYRFDFTEWLRDCQDTIADKQVDAFGDGALQVTQVDQLDGSVAALVAGGVNGKTYKLTCTITTAGGRKKEADIQIRIKES